MSAISKGDVRQILEVALSSKFIKKALGWKKGMEAHGEEKINIEFYLSQFGSICSIRLAKPVEKNNEGKHLVPESSLGTSDVRRQFIDIFTEKLLEDIEEDKNLEKNFAGTLYKIIKDSDDKRVKSCRDAIFRPKVIKKVGEIIAKSGQQEQMLAWLNSASRYRAFYQEMMFAYFESLEPGSIAPNFVIESAKKFMKEGWWMSLGGEDAMVNTLVKLNLENEKDFLDFLEAEVKNPSQYIKFEYVEQIKKKLSEYARTCTYEGESGMLGGSVDDGQLFVHRGVFRRGFFFEKFGQDKAGVAKATHMMEFLPNILEAAKSVLRVDKKDDEWLSGSGVLTHKAMYSRAFYSDDFSKLHDNEFCLVATSQKQLNEAKDILRLVELNCDDLADYLVNELNGVKGVSHRAAKMFSIGTGLIDLLKAFEIKRDVVSIGSGKDEEEALSTSNTRSRSLKM